MISETEFSEVYNPLPFGPHDELVREHADVKDEDLHHVWTIVDGDDGNLYATTGFHIVDKVGYVLTEKPWTDDGDDIAEWCVFEMDADRLLDTVRDDVHAFTEGALTREEVMNAVGEALDAFSRDGE